MRAYSNASQVNSRASRCCGSMLSASIFDSAKNSASKPLRSFRYPPRVRAFSIRSASRGSVMNSAQRPSGRSVMASLPSSSACHISSGVFISPGNRVARPTMAMLKTSSSTSRDQSSSPSVNSDSGSPSMITTAKASMVGWRKATVAVSVTPVRSSISLAIATASRDDSPSSTIGTDSSTASGACPVALATQLRSHSRISGTVISVRGAAKSFSGAMINSSAGCESDSDIGPSVVVIPLRGRRWRPSRRGGCRPGRPTGMRSGRSCRSRCAESRRPASAGHRGR